MDKKTNLESVNVFCGRSENNRFGSSGYSDLFCNYSDVLPWQKVDQKQPMDICVLGIPIKLYAQWQKRGHNSPQSLLLAPDF